MDRWLPGHLPAARLGCTGRPRGRSAVTDAGARTFQRFLFGTAFEVDLDRQGRLVVPAVLRDFAALEGETVVVGSRDHLELWSLARWSAYSAEMDAPEVLAGHLQGLGI